MDLVTDATPATRPSTWRRRLGRRTFVGLVFGMLLAPLAAHVLGVQGAPPLDEKRRMADRPGLPRSAEELLALPAQVDAYLSDHFGLRRGLVGLNNRLRYRGFGEVASPQVTVGKDGFLFFNSHAADAPLSMVHYLCGRGVTPAALDATAASIAATMRRALARHPGSMLLVVPTKPVLYAEKLPDWVQGQCAGGLPPGAGVLERLGRDPAMASHVLYPLAEMAALKDRFDVYPRPHFHWEGEGARRVAELVSAQAFGLDRLVELPRVEERIPSDVQHLVPGVRLQSRAQLPDYAAAGVRPCYGGDCFPELGPAAHALGDVSRYRHETRAGPRLLVVSDSFGIGVAGYFSQSFGEVWHLSTNDLEQLTPEQLRQVREVALGAYGADRILFVFHDFSLGYFWRKLDTLLGEEATGAASR